jgi:outer membrane protein TolC
MELIPMPKNGPNHIVPRTIAALMVFFVGGGALAATAEDSGPTLESLLRSTLAKNGQIQESVEDIEIARSQLEQARAAVWPHASALLLAAPIFEERGNALRSTSNWNKWGPFLQGAGQVVQPLYSFGMLDSYKRAAENQILARAEQADMKRLEILATAKEFYYGYLMATALDNLVDDLVGFLEEAVKTAEENTTEESGGKHKKSSIKPHDVYRLKAALEDLRQKKLLAVQGRRTAEHAVSWISGMNFEHLPDRPLEAEAFEKKPIDDYLKIARANRPEYRALKAGQEARAALRDAKRAQSYPLVFVGGFVSQSWSPVRDYQPSVYANDPFNHLQGGIGLGIKFDLEFKRHSAEAAEQNAEMMKLKATESYAVPGIELQVRRAYWEVEQAMQGIEIAERRKAMTKKWFISSAMGWSVGITPPKDLLEALEGNGLAKRNYIETVYNLNLSLSHLSQAVGQEITALKYRNN